MQHIWQVKVYSSGYDDPSLRGVEEDRRPWDFVEEVRSYCSPDCALLDIGCGTARKIMPLATGVAELWGLEPSEEMRTDARKIATSAGIPNFHIVDGVAEVLPFPDGRFDLVTSVMAPHTTREVWRVLKPGGTAIFEKIGEQDKVNIKAFFGHDQEGPRGQFIGPDGERERFFRADLSEFLYVISVRSGKWRTVFSMEGLLKLLHETITIRNFDLERDSSALERIQKELLSPHGIETFQHRLLFIARKPTS
jgi:SAM-dependent methyltransferase